MTDKDDDDFIKLLDMAKQLRTKNPTGDSPKDFLYYQASSVRKSSVPGFVYVTYEGKEYGPVRETFGPLDGDKNKSTVLVKIDNKYYKLWYFDAEVK
jgi:hypothetical protein